MKIFYTLLLVSSFCLLAFVFIIKDLYIDGFAFDMIANQSYCKNKEIVSSQDLDEMKEVKEILSQDFYFLKKVKVNLKRVQL